MSEADGLTASEKQYFETGGQAEPKVEPQGEVVKDEPKKPPEGFVPHGALHEERERRKALQNELTETKNRITHLESLRSQVEELREVYKKQSQPSYEDDPLQAIHESNLAIQRKLAEHEEYMRLQEHNREYAQQQEAVDRRYIQAARSYNQVNPEFQNAYQFVMGERLKQYSALGYNEEEARHIILEEERQIVQRAFSDEVNPAERIYNLAVASGYTPKSNSDLKTVKNGIEQAQTLSNSSSTTEGNDTIQKLLELEGEEFDKAWAKLMG